MAAHTIRVACRLKVQMKVMGIAMAAKKTAHNVALEKLLEKAKDMISIKELHDRLQGLVEGERTKEELTDYRLHRGAVKRLTDELFPVSRFFTYASRAVDLHEEVERTLILIS